MRVPEAAPPIEELAPDVQTLVRMTRWVPPLDTLSVPLARAIYQTAAYLFNPAPRDWAEVQRWGHNLLLFEPRKKSSPRAAYFFIHGGGWTLGTAGAYRSYCAWLAARTGSSVYALDYRRAPEHPYPAALEDSLQSYLAWQKLLAPDGPIHLVGDSAGAHLILALCYRLRIMKAQLPDSLTLHYPLVGRPGKRGSYETFAAGPFLSRSMMEWFWKLYAPAEDQEECFALGWKDFDCLPPVSLCLARHDVLFDEGFALAQALDRVGVLRSLHIARDLPHAYLNFLRCPSVMASLERQIQSQMAVAVS